MCYENKLLILKLKNMSMIKAYIDKMMDAGIDVLAETNSFDYDAEYLEYLKSNYRQSLDEMNEYFMEHSDETE